MDYNVDDFIAYHNSKHKCYCEAIVLPDGRVTYSEPSHVIKLETMWGVPLEEVYEGGPTRDKLWRIIPQYASPVHWLSEALNCVVLWYNSIIFPPNYTEDQIESVTKLMKSKCIDPNSVVQVTVEQSICDPSNQNEQSAYQIIERKHNTLTKVHQDLSKKNYKFGKRLDFSIYSVYNNTCNT